MIGTRGALSDLLTTESVAPKLPCITVFAKAKMGPSAGGSTALTDAGISKLVQFLRRRCELHGPLRFTSWCVLFHRRLGALHPAELAGVGSWVTLWRSSLVWRLEPVVLLRCGLLARSSGLVHQSYGLNLSGDGVFVVFISRQCFGFSFH